MVILDHIRLITSVSLEATIGQILVVQYQQLPLLKIV